MRFFLTVILIAMLSAVATYFLPWWMIAVVCFLVSLFSAERTGRSFLMGFLGIALFWLAAALLHDIPNEHILSSRMAKLFTLPGYPWFIVATVFLGALVGGLAAWAGSLMRPKK